MFGSIWSVVRVLAKEQRKEQQLTSMIENASLALIPQKRKLRLPSPILSSLSSPTTTKTLAATYLLPSDKITNPDSISCICGFTFDDGFSIACDDCSRWCHAACFDIVEGEVPEEWRCWACVPRPVDRQRATRIQRQKRAHMEDAANATAGKGNGNGRRRMNSPNGNGDKKHRRAIAPAIDGGGGNVNGKRKRRPSIVPPPTPTTGDDQELEVDCSSSYVPIERDIHTDSETKHKLRKQSQHWRGITALDNSAAKSPVQISHAAFRKQPATQVQPLPPSSLHHPSLSLHTNPAVRPPAYALHTTSPIPSAELITPYTSAIVSSSSYLADPLNAYAHLGMPKPFVHLLGNPWDLAVDSRLAGNQARFARSGCRPNAVLRPVLCSDPGSSSKSSKAKSKEKAREREGEDEDDDDESMLRFGVFALRDLKANEEVVLGWEWDDGNAVHRLPALISQPHLFPPDQIEYLRAQMSGILHALGSTFTTCACGASAKDCALNRMAAFVDDDDRGQSQDQEVDLGPLVGVERGFMTREKVPLSGGMGGVEMAGSSEAAHGTNGSKSDEVILLSPSLRRGGERRGKGKEREEVVVPPVPPPAQGKKRSRRRYTITDEPQPVFASVHPPPAPPQLHIPPSPFESGEEEVQPPKMRRRWVVRSKMAENPVESRSRGSPPLCDEGWGRGMGPQMGRFPTNHAPPPLSSSSISSSIPPSSSGSLPPSSSGSIPPSVSENLTASTLTASTIAVATNSRLGHPPASSVSPSASFAQLSLVGLKGRGSGVSRDVVSSGNVRAGAEGDGDETEDELDGRGQGKDRWMQQLVPDRDREELDVDVDVDVEGETDVDVDVEREEKRGTPKVSFLELPREEEDSDVVPRSTSPLPDPNKMDVDVDKQAEPEAKIDVGVHDAPSFSPKDAREEDEVESSPLPGIDSSSSGSSLSEPSPRSSPLPMSVPPTPVPPTPVLPTLIAVRRSTITVTDSVLAVTSAPRPGMIVPGKPRAPQRSRVITPPPVESPSAVAAALPEDVSVTQVEGESEDVAEVGPKEEVARNEVEEREKSSSPRPRPQPRPPSPPKPKVKLSLKDFALRKKKQREEELALAQREEETRLMEGAASLDDPDAGLGDIRANGDRDRDCVGKTDGVTISPPMSVHAALGPALNGAASGMRLVEEGEGERRHLSVPPSAAPAPSLNGHYHGDRASGPNKAVSLSPSITLRVPLSPSKGQNNATAGNQAVNTIRATGPTLLKAKVELVEAGLPPKINGRTMDSENSPSLAKSAPLRSPVEAPQRSMVDSAHSQRSEEEDGEIVPPTRECPPERKAPPPISVPPSGFSVSPGHSVPPGHRFPRSHSPPTQPRSFHVGPPTSPGGHSVSTPSPSASVPPPRRPSHPPQQPSAYRPPPPSTSSPSMMGMSRPPPSGPRALRAGNGGQTSRAFPPGGRSFSGSSYVPGRMGDRDRGASGDWDRPGERGWNSLSRSRGRGWR